MSLVSTMCLLALARHTDEPIRASFGGILSLDLPFEVQGDAKAGYSGSGEGLTLKLKRVRRTLTDKNLDLYVTDIGKALRGGSDVRSFKGGSTLRFSLANQPSRMLRYNLLMTDGAEKVVDYGVIQAGGELWEIDLRGDRRNADAMEWLSRAFQSLRVTEGGNSYGIQEFGADGRLWQSWSSNRMQIGIRMPHTPWIEGGRTPDYASECDVAVFADKSFDVRAMTMKLKDSSKVSTDTLLKDAFSDLASISPGIRPDMIRNAYSRTFDGMPGRAVDLEVAGVGRVTLAVAIKGSTAWSCRMLNRHTDETARSTAKLWIDSVRLK